MRAAACAAIPLTLPFSRRRFYTLCSLHRRALPTEYVMQWIRMLCNARSFLIVQSSPDVQPQTQRGDERLQPELCTFHIKCNMAG